MRRSLHSALIGGTILLAATGLAQAQAPAPGRVHVRCRISVPSGVTEPLTMAAQIYRVGRDNFGNYKLQGDVQSLIVALSPGAGGTASGVFDTDLDPGTDVEYEFKVVPLDKDGNERTDGRYYFVSPDVAGDLFEKTFTLRPGEVNEIIVNLRWLTRAQQYKSNFVQVVPRTGRTEYFLSLYTNDSTDINVMN
jgi:hypothetical protein